MNVVKGRPPNFSNMAEGRDVGFCYCVCFKEEPAMAKKHQRGWLKKEKCSQGETWMLFFRTIRKSDRKRVENKIPIGLVKDFPTKDSAWTEVERQHLRINQVDFRGSVTFADLAYHYAGT
jgi:hypothetical protein